MNNTNKENDFRFYAGSRIAGGIFAALAVLWVFSLFFGSSDSSETHTAKEVKHGVHEVEVKKDLHSAPVKDNPHKEASHEVAVKEEPHKTADHSSETAKKDSHEKDINKHETESHGTEVHEKEEKGIVYRSSGESHSDITGWSFVESAVQPLKYELDERTLGWRPNDLILGKFTDNVNNFQRGVLEVTRRTAVKLAEEISRTGSTASFNPHLENAMNWFMIRPDKFWFPSAEGKYKAGLEELVKYQEQLVRGEARFYNRSDNIIPLLKAYRNLLGSCDDNLVKKYEDDGKEVSFFKTDDYFYYSKGVAKSMAHILKAVEHDFYPILESRNGLGSIHHAIHALEEAEDIKPWFILDHNLSGIFANHRANLATAISHGRFYLGVLITTLST